MVKREDAWWWPAAQIDVPAERRRTYARRMGLVKAKKKCCRDRPRCKACPVVLQRLADAGYAKRESKRRYVFATKPPKKVVAGARAS